MNTMDNTRRHRNNPSHNRYNRGHKNQTHIGLTADKMNIHRKPMAAACNKMMYKSTDDKNKTDRNNSGDEKSADTCYDRQSAVYKKVDVVYGG